jgi:hypothetical protein
MTHGAVIARETGPPAAGIEHTTQRTQDGRQIRPNGDSKMPGFEYDALAT